MNENATAPAATIDINALFLRATRLKLRFQTTKGTMSVEDLWDLPLNALDALTVSLEDALSKTRRKSFITEEAKSNTELELQFEIAKVVIYARLEEAKVKKAAAEKRRQVEFLKGLRDKKKLEAFEALTAEELDKQLAELGAVD